MNPRPNHLTDLVIVLCVLALLFCGFLPGCGNPQARITVSPAVAADLYLMLTDRAHAWLVARMAAANDLRRRGLIWFGEERRVEFDLSLGEWSGPIRLRDGYVLPEKPPPEIVDAPRKEWP
jgi:hypothetical protein